MASLSDFTSSLANNVIEAKFIRRRPKAGMPATRRAFITNSTNILNSAKGKTVLGFNGFGTGAAGLGFFPVNKNLVLAWDILWQSFRLFGAEGSQIITKIPVSNEKEIETFWQYFEKNIQSMSPAQKLQFMNS
jgi:hypothetical protein